MISCSRLIKAYYYYATTAVYEDSEKFGLVVYDFFCHGRFCGIKELRTMGYI